MEAHCLTGALASSLVQCPVHSRVPTGNHNLARRIDVSNEYRVLDRSYSLHDFRDLRFIQSHDCGETVACRVELHHLLCSELHQLGRIRQGQHTSNNRSGKCADGEAGNRGGLDSLLHEGAGGGNSRREQGELRRDVKLEAPLAVQIAHIGMKHFADFIESAENGRMIEQSVQHPGRLRSLSGENKCDTHEAIASLGDRWLQGSSPKLKPSGYRNNILPDELRAYSWSENPHSGVSTRMSSLVCRSIAHSHKNRACSAEIRTGARMTISRSLSSVVTRRPVASSNPRLPIGPHGQVSSCQLLMRFCKAFLAGVCGTGSGERQKFRSSSGRTIFLTMQVLKNPPHRSLRVAPRTPTAIWPSGALARRTTTQGHERSACSTQNGAAILLTELGSIWSRSCTSGLSISESCICYSFNQDDLRSQSRRPGWQLQEHRKLSSQNLRAWDLRLSPCRRRCRKTHRVSH